MFLLVHGDCVLQDSEHGGAKDQGEDDADDCRGNHVLGIAAEEDGEGTGGERVDQQLLPEAVGLASADSVDSCRNLFRAGMRFADPAGELVELVQLIEIVLILMILYIFMLQFLIKELCLKLEW